MKKQKREIVAKAKYMYAYSANVAFKRRLISLFACKAKTLSAFRYAFRQRLAKNTHNIQTSWFQVTHRRFKLLIDKQKIHYASCWQHFEAVKFINDSGISNRTETLFVCRSHFPKCYVIYFSVAVFFVIVKINMLQDVADNKLHNLLHP